MSGRSTISRLRENSRSGEHTYYIDIAAFKNGQPAEASPACWIDGGQTVFQAVTPANGRDRPAPGMVIGAVGGVPAGGLDARAALKNEAPVRSRTVR